MIKKRFSFGLAVALTASVLGVGSASADPTYEFGFYFSFSKGQSVLNVNCDELPNISGNWNTGIRVSPQIAGKVVVTGTCDEPNANSGGLSFGDENQNIDEADYPGSITFGGTTYEPQDNWLRVVPSSFTVDKTEPSMVTITSANRTNKLTIYSIPLNDSETASQANIGSEHTARANPAGMSLLKTETMSIPGTNPSKMIIPDLADAGAGLNLNGNPDCEIKKGFHVYTKKTIKITKAGNFTFRAVATTPLNSGIAGGSGHGASSTGLGDPFLAVYKNFDPNDPDSTNPAKQVVGCNDDGENGVGATTTGYLISRQLSNFTAELQPGDYTLVLTTWRNINGATWAEAAGNWSTLVSEVGTAGKQSATFELWGPRGAFDVAPTASTNCSKKLGTVYFKADSSALTKEAKKNLKKMAKSVKDSGCKSVSLKGYTATTSDYAKSLKPQRVELAKARNAAVTKYLKSQFKSLGVSVKIKKKSFGAADPVSSNKSPESRWKNRRVEISLAAS